MSSGSLFPFTNEKEIRSPGILSVFSLNSTMTHVWSYLVLTKYPDLIKEIISSNKPRIILAEFSPKIPNDIIHKFTRLIIYKVL